MITIYRELENQRQYYLRYVDKKQQNDHEILSSFNFLFRPFLKAYINDLRVLVDRYEPLRIQKQVEEEMKQENAPKKYNVSWVAPSKVAEKRENQTLVMRIFGFFGQESIINRSCDFVWNMLLHHMKSIRNNGIYEKVNLENVPWTGSDFFVWTIHLWVLFRRLRFEGSDGDLLAKKLCDRFWNYVEHYLSDNFSVNGYTMPKNLKRLQTIHYGILIQLDEILDLESSANIDDSLPTNWDAKTMTNLIKASSDQDAMIAEVVWRNFYCGGVEFNNLDVDDSIKGEVEVSAEDLMFWVRYIRYVLCWTDHVDSHILTRGLFHYHLPTDDFVTKFQVTEKPREPEHLAQGAAKQLG